MIVQSSVANIDAYDLKPALNGRHEDLTFFAEIHPEGGDELFSERKPFLFIKSAGSVAIGKDCRPIEFLVGQGCCHGALQRRGDRLSSMDPELAGSECFHDYVNCFVSPPRHGFQDVGREGQPTVIVYVGHLARERPVHGAIWKDFILINPVEKKVFQRPYMAGLKTFSN